MTIKREASVLCEGGGSYFASLSSELAVIIATNKKDMIDKMTNDSRMAQGLNCPNSTNLHIRWRPKNKSKGVATKTKILHLYLPTNSQYDT